MKKSFAFLLIVLFAALAVPQAQAITFGLKGGLNFANINANGNDIPAFKNLNGLTGGVFFSLGAGAVSIQPEILYSRRGVSMSITEGDATMDAKIMLDYIEVPVFLKLKVVQAGPLKPFVFGGPSYSYLLKAKEKLTYNGESETADNTDYFKRSEIAAVFGAGVDLNLAAVKLSIDGRYHLGLTDIIAETGDGVGTAKNKGFSVLVGIAF